MASRYLANSLDVSGSETRRKWIRDGARTVFPDLGAHPLAFSSRHAAPDAVVLVVHHRPTQAVQANGTRGADPDGVGTSVRLLGKPQIRVMAEAQCEFTPRCHARPDPGVTTGGSGENEGTRFMTPSSSFCSARAPGGGSIVLQRWSGDRSTGSQFHCPFAQLGGCRWLARTWPEPGSR